LVIRVARSACSFIAGTKITIWIIGKGGVGMRRLKLAAPGPPGAMRRNQDPIAREWIEPPMRILIEIFELHLTVAFISRFVQPVFFFVTLPLAKLALLEWAHKYRFQA
jgi:hypothetical protein